MSICIVTQKTAQAGSEGSEGRGQGRDEGIQGAGKGRWA